MSRTTAEARPRQSHPNPASGTEAAGVPHPPVSSTCVSSSPLTSAFCRIWAVQMTMSLCFTTEAKKDFSLLSPLMAVTLKSFCSTLNSFLACCSTKCTCSPKTPLSPRPPPSSTAREPVAGGCWHPIATKAGDWGWVAPC